MKPLSECVLYAFIDTAYLQGRKPGDVAAQLCAGGADIIQVRAKGCSKAEVRALAHQVLPITRASGVWLVLNDYVDVAADVGADICHLGQEDFFDAGYTHVDQLPGRRNGLRIGLSTHAPAQAERAVAAGADYVAIGPIYPTGTKPSAKPVTLEYVRWAAKHVKIPWFAIGGVNETTLPDVLAAGARRVCIVSAILNAVDVASQCKKFRGIITNYAEQ